MNPCRICTAKCCKYFAMQLDTPRSKDDFENIRWYLAHEQVEVYVEKKKWFLDVKNKCRYLSGENLCLIYDRRPLICREHDVSECEHGESEFALDRVFKNIGELDEYIEARFSRGRKK